MRPQLELVPIDSESSFRCEEFAGAELACGVHFHPEVEILQVVRGEGNWTTGDYAGTMRAGQVFVLGPDLPHSLKMPQSGKARSRASECIRVIQFHRDCMGADLFEIPEMREVRHLVERSIRGLRIQATPSIEQLVKRIIREPPPKRPPLLLMLLAALATVPADPLASPGYMATFRPGNSERLDRIHRIVLENFGDLRFNQQEAARLVSVSPAALSRFFKRRTGKDFSEFLTEVRIGQVCRMLQESDESILSISLACGFGNLSNFNRRFRQFKGMTPKAYRRSKEKG